MLGNFLAFYAGYIFTIFSVIFVFGESSAVYWLVFIIEMKIKNHANYDFLLHIKC